MSVNFSVTEVMRQFLPAFLKSDPPLCADQWRAIAAMENCRSPALGGRLFRCEKCRELRFVYHSCNHKACPQCGRQATAQWVERELSKRIEAPYFMVTFTWKLCFVTASTDPGHPP
jgi:hypothetical protein